MILVAVHDLRYVKPGASKSLEIEDAEARDQT